MRQYEIARWSHGPVRADGTHFRYEDGTPYYPFGTTVYALTHQPKELVDKTMETLRGSPFNKLRLCVFPKDFPYNKNEPPLFPFERSADGWDMERPCLPFWDELSRRIAELGEMGIEADVILLHPYDRWGFAHLSVPDVVKYLRYAVKRLCVFPNVWWSLANEYDIMEYTMDDWRLFAKTVSEADPHGHLLSNHNMVIPWDFAEPHTTHICLQLKEVDEVSRVIRDFGKPLMVDECRYEGNIPWEWGNISGWELTDRFWKIVCQGGYASHGETFLDPEDILWWSKGGVLHGESPARIGFLRTLVEGLPGPLTYGGTDPSDAELLDILAAPQDYFHNEAFGNLKGKMSLSQLRRMLLDGREFRGVCGDEAILVYFSRSCPGIYEFSLPAENTYRIELIDAWNMRRESLFSGVSGKVICPLPGREYMALLATKE